MSERRSLIGLAVVCLLVAVGAVGYGAGKASDVPEVIRAQRFEVVDGEGRTRAALGCQEDGGASLVFTGKDGHLWATLGAARDGTSGLILYDGAGHERAVLGRSAEGESTLLLVGQEGTGSAGLDLAPKKWTHRYAALAVDSRSNSTGARYPSDECSRCRL